jgi:hypothetical protein
MSIEQQEFEISDLRFQNRIAMLVALLSNLKAQISNSPQAPHEVRMIRRSTRLESGGRDCSADLCVVKSSLVSR